MNSKSAYRFGSATRRAGRACSENGGFVCERCGSRVEPLTNGSFRNHCPVCLYSKHVDERPGDRASECGGMMEPIGFVHSGKKGYQIEHRCLECGVIKRNKVATDTAQPDDFIGWVRSRNGTV